MSSRRKVTVVGAGNVGATCAQVLATRDYADVVLVDIKEGLPQGKALDINQMGAVLGYEPNCTGSNGLRGDRRIRRRRDHRGPPPLAGHVAATTSCRRTRRSSARSPRRSSAQSPDAILIIVSNPLDAMCHVAKNVSRLPKERVFGMAGILDTARFSTFISWETGSSVKDVQAMVLGGHGDQMVPVVSATTVGGIPLRKLVAEDKIAAMVERTAKGGGELVNLWHVGLVRAGRGGRADGRLDHARREARPPVHRVPRGRVRHRRPLHGRARASSARRASRRSSSSTSQATRPPRSRRARRRSARSSASSRRSSTAARGVTSDGRAHAEMSNTDVSRCLAPGHVWK